LSATCVFKLRLEANVGIGGCGPTQPPILAISAQAIRKGRLSHFGAQFAEIWCWASTIPSMVITSEYQSERPELTADPSTARQQQISFVPAPFMLRFGSNIEPAKAEYRTSQ
jgi:hypothetical protein